LTAARTDPKELEATERAGDLAPPVHAENIADLLARVGVADDGLSLEDAAARLAKHGRNELPEPEKDPWWRRLLEQFKDPLVLTLLAAATVAGALAQFADAIAILLIVILNAIIGFYQEKRAEAALEALKKLAAPNARVVRNGKSMVIDAAEVVPGDVLEIEAGDAVAADARLTQTYDLASEEAALTGESMPRGKDALAAVAPDAPLGDRETMIYTGTVIVRGKGRAVVTATGPGTELGRIGAMLASIGDQQTPLEERLDNFGKIILRVCLGTSAVLMAWGFARPILIGGEARPWHSILLEAVALAVAAIPEGLPAITTITLALGMQRMARRGAIVRKLPAVETLGAATIICSDKTGTLTKNEMTVRELYTYGTRYKVTGEGYAPEGAITTEDGKSLDERLPDPLEKTLRTAALCNNARLQLDDAEKRWKVLGDPTEGALLTLAAKADMPQESVRSSISVVSELPFDSTRKRMTVVTRDARGRAVAHVKGGLDVLLERCESVFTDDGPTPLTEAMREEIQKVADDMSRRALRVLAFCGRVEVEATGDADAIEHHLTFLGIAGMMDPPRPEVIAAVDTCSKAGIRAVMITGDHKLTAQAIAEEIGMWAPDDRVITGSELDAHDDDALDKDLMQLRVFARTTPEQKLRIVRAFKRAGHVVAMTGDGVNDAPALREANIGVAMGKMGTDVARQAADLVLSDDNFATIVDAVREGRAIYRNIQKFIFFLLSSNMGLVVTVFVVSFFGAWPPLTPLMVLWINLVTNGAPALALGIDPPDKRLMEEPPRPVNEGLMVFRDYLGILFVGGIMGGAAIAIYALSPQDPQSLEHARALAFTVLALSPLMHSFSCRSPIRSALSARPLLSLPLLVAVAISASIHLVAVLVPSLQPIFKTFPISAIEWAQVLGLAFLVFPAVEIAKAANRKRMAMLGVGPPPPSYVPSRRGR
jgi:Ca2+-transporting ATPase